ncbi:MAG: VOC family protein [Pseudomonadota bacterium]
MAEALNAFLMFEDAQAEPAMAFYTSLFEDGDVLEVTRFPEGGPGKAGTIMTAKFRMAGQEVMCTDSPAAHDFSFTPATSFFVTCSDAAEQTRLYEALMDGGSALMPMGEYGFSQRFAWVNDRYGVSWQLNLP